MHVAPCVAEAVQLRLADAWVVVDRDLADPQLAPEGLEDHLGGELHPGRVEVEGLEGVAPHRAHAAVGVGDLHAEEDVEEAGEDRVADVPVEPRHRLAVDRPLEARAHDEVVAGREALDERCEVAHRVRLVGVAHHDEVAARDGEARRGTRCRSRAVPRERRSRRARPRPRPSGRSRRCRRRSPRLGGPSAWMPSHAWSTTAPTASSSFRHGMTTEISGPSTGCIIGDPSGDRLGAAERCQRPISSRGEAGRLCSGSSTGPLRELARSARSARRLEAGATLEAPSRGIAGTASRTPRLTHRHETRHWTRA